MEIYRKIGEISNIEPTVVALGNFDGIHRGHQALISGAVKKAREKGLKSAVFTFANHPRNVLAGECVIKNILYEEDKQTILEADGVDYLFSLDFNKAIQTMSPDAFIKDLLVDAFNIREAYCGFNYNFGFKAQGTPQFLTERGNEFGFHVNIVNPVIVNGMVVSSTLIRQLISEGEMEQANILMGRNYSICGKVIHGNHFGRTIGFPTSNIVTDNSMVTPPNGVYVTYCDVDGRRLNSITNVGNKPTVGDYTKNIETNILDFSEDIYGKKIRVEFIKMMRPEQRFGSIEQLRKQIAGDCQTARQYHEEHSL